MSQRDSHIAFLAVLAWTLLLGLLFGIQYLTDRHNALTMMLQAARGIHQQIVLTREWNAGHGGVYVPVTETTSPNPFLPSPGRTVTTTDGQVLARVNPAFMTRQISELAAKRDGVTLHITSLKPLRLDNAPTPWETRALWEFEEDIPEVSDLDQTGREPVFRYMAPLFVTQSCLGCHAKQGYQTGEVRGGISVNLPAAHFMASQSAALGGTAGLYALIWLVGAVSTFVGVTNILSSKTRAEAASRAKSTFMAILSHELRTPLNGVLGMLELARDTSLNAEQQSLLADAQTAAVMMHTLVQELLELAGLENGQGTLQTTRFSPSVLATSATAAAADAARSKGLGFALVSDQAPPEQLLGDGARLARIVSILAENAVKFTTAGQVTVTVFPDHTRKGPFHLAVSVADSGCGIAPERLAAIFEPFFQAEAVLTRRKSGLGIGLTIARKHAEILGASLTGQSQPGIGSTFTISAPFQIV